MEQKKQPISVIKLETQATALQYGGIRWIDFVTMKLRILLCCAVACSLTAFDAGAQTKSDPSIPHLEKHGTATQLVVDGKPFLMLAGELHNSSTSDIGYMKPIWPRMVAMNLNAVIAAVSWELIEPVEGKFDFKLVDAMLDGARENHLKLVLIWFGSWKNGASTYMPSWVKKDFNRFPRAKDESGRTLEILSTFGGASCDADAHAFAALMRHLREVDGQKHTVLMVQVENEVGVLNESRDYCEVADQAFKSDMPKVLVDYLVDHKDTLIPELRELWETNGFKTSGTWEEIFGPGKPANLKIPVRTLSPPLTEEEHETGWRKLHWPVDEIFMAWNYARYVNKVAAAGKAEYNIPMYVNAWLQQRDHAWPGTYPSGGPVPQVHDIWRAGAPAIDILAPDLYVPEFAEACARFNRGGNPLFIPETRGGIAGAANVFYAVGQHDAMCFSPFGIDSMAPTNAGPLAQSYAALSQLSPLILANQGQGKMAGVLVTANEPSQSVTLGGYMIQAKLAGRGNAEVAGAIIISTGPDEFFVAGKGLDILFEPNTPGDLPLAAIDFVDEGTFSGEKWMPARRLNGDEVHTSTFDGTGLKLYGPAISIQHLKLHRYR